MKNKNKIIAVSLSLMVFLPFVTFAAGLIPCNGTPDSPCDFNAFARLVNNIINWFIGISVSVAAVTFSIAGAKILLNPDNPSEREAAVRMFRMTVIGMLIILGAWLVVHTIISALVNSDTNALRFLKS